MADDDTAAEKTCVTVLLCLSYCSLKEIMRLYQNIVVLLFISALVTTTVAQEQQQQQGTCESEDGTTCQNPAAAKTSSVCGVHSELCQAEKSSLYSHGGSAQAYVPNALVKTQVCNNNDKTSKHKVATWPFTRSTRRTAPNLMIRANLWSCASTENDCCCESLAESSAKAQVWQARPDGTYSSLQSSNNKGDCRATVLAENGRLEFTTVAPGSTGALGGLGPGGWDVAPYGPPVVHMLLTADNHEPLLIHVPIVVNAKSLEESSFWGGDLRGHAGRTKSQTDAFKVTSWSVVGGDEEIEILLDVFLTKRDSSSSSEDLMKELLCPSFLYGLPRSFFVEPIAVCAPYLLNFFPL